MDATRWLVVPGSSRTGSLNRKLAGVAAGLAARRGVHVDLFDLAALELPVYHADLEAASGVPAGALRLLDAIVAADAVLIVTPEYNGFPTPLVINPYAGNTCIAAEVTTLLHGGSVTIDVNGVVN